WLGLPVSDVRRDHDGLIMIQIDGLSRRELENAIEQGRMPFLKSLLDRQGYRLHSFYSGLPSSTPAVQGELFYGIKTAVPAFGFVDHETNQSVLMFSPDAAAKVQKHISEGKIGLLHGGSSYCNIYDGGADESHFCAASIGWDQILRAVGPSRIAVVVIGYGFSLVRATRLVFVEIWIGLFDFLRRAITGRELWQELLMIASRVVVAVGLRELTIISASMDAARGLPIIHWNLLGYDEHAHRRGPSSRFARWTLKGIDRCLDDLPAPPTYPAAATTTSGFTRIMVKRPQRSTKLSSERAFKTPVSQRSATTGIYRLMASLVGRINELAEPNGFLPADSLRSYSARVFRIATIPKRFASPIVVRWVCSIARHQ
ncbi:MAG: hypothetical protein ABJ015_11315, partial [Rhodopirellula bahusiensis]